MRTRQTITILLLIFLVYAVVRNPAGTGNAFSAFWDVLWGAAVSIPDFFRSMTS